MVKPLRVETYRSSIVSCIPCTLPLYIKYLQDIYNNKSTVTLCGVTGPRTYANQSVENDNVHKSKRHFAKQDNYSSVVSEFQTSFVVSTYFILEVSVGNITFQKRKYQRDLII